jgi:hypothetical protein
MAATDDRWLVALRLAHRYADAINHRDYGRLASCWAEHGRWLADAPFGIDVGGREQIVAEAAGRIDRMAAWSMAVASVELVSGDDRTLDARTTIWERGQPKLGVPAIRHVGSYNDTIRVLTDGTAVYEQRSLTPQVFERHTEAP